MRLICCGACRSNFSSLEVRRYAAIAKMAIAIKARTASKISDASGPIFERVRNRWVHYTIAKGTSNALCRWFYIEASAAARDAMIGARSLRGFMLRTRQLVPPLTLHTADGRNVHAWDFKQKKNLVVVFLDAGCALCEDFLRSLGAQAARLRASEAVVLAVFLEPPAPGLFDSHPGEIIAALTCPDVASARFWVTMRFPRAAFRAAPCSSPTVTVNSLRSGFCAIMSFQRSTKSSPGWSTQASLVTIAPRPSGPSTPNSRTCARKKRGGPIGPPICSTPRIPVSARRNRPTPG